MDLLSLVYIREAFGLGMVSAHLPHEVGPHNSERGLWESGEGNSCLLYGSQLQK